MSQIATKPKALPALVMGAEDNTRLTALAEGVTGPAAEVAKQLMTELERTRVVSQSRIPRDAVRMGSMVSFNTSDGFDRTFQLVYPGDADISAGRVSVLTPIGAALIGLREGQTIPWTARDGRRLSLTVISVQQDG